MKDEHMARCTPLKPYRPETLAGRPTEMPSVYIPARKGLSGAGMQRAGVIVCLLVLAFFAYYVDYRVSVALTVALALVVHALSPAP
jgi:hypothetical protein